MSQAFLLQWLPILVLAGLAILFVGVNLGLSKLLGDDRPLFAKVTPYESGNVPEGDARHNVSIHYNLVAILFILFDIEVIFLYPWALTVDEASVVWPAMVAMLVFTGLLAVGYFYAWREGAYEWT